MPKSSWKETLVCEELENRSDKYAESMKNLLKNSKAMDTIEMILNKGASTPKDFTLHDADHSFRVAERMWEIIPDKTKKILSAYELGFLLLSSYLHDIGMSPEFEKVENHRKYLTAKEKDSLTTEEINDFQKWIDDNYNAKQLGIQSVDIRKDIVDKEEISNEILTYYIRHKHNDWSEEWIQNNLSDISLDSYPQWIDDLIKICRSHHNGIEELKKKDFDPLPIGGQITVHLRYLAMCLRVADVMENDPERTPEVILRHRNIAETSIKYWEKDHYFSLVKDDNRYSIVAKPPKAYLHKAIEETSQLIENELKLCVQLKAERPLEHSSYKTLHDYEWNIDANVNKDITPFNNNYEYVPGTFRPNPARILELLGGTQLYGNPIWAVRELLQNAFDAVKEQIAYRILREDKDPKIWYPKFGEINEIKLQLVEKEDGYWLVCKDSGVGMTKDVIVKYFLESGSAKRHETYELERRCKAKNFNLGRTGQFGIGVLSYFMIADKVLIHTKRSQGTGYDDEASIGWEFEINGIHDFGELKKTVNFLTGTEIQLKLKKSIEQNISKWDNACRSMLKNNIIKAPCTITYQSCLSESNIIIINQGWAKSLKDIKDLIIEEAMREIISSDEQNDNLISAKQREEKRAYELLANEAIYEMETEIQFLSSEGKLPNNRGRFRIHVPYFKLIEGNSFFYLKEEIDSEGHKILEINRGHYFLPDFRIIHYSLKDFNIGATTNSKDLSDYLTRPNLSNAFIELDIETINDFSLAVSRHSLQLDESFSQVIEFVESEVIKLIQENENLFDNIYDSLNQFITKKNVTEPYWAFELEKGKLPEKQSYIVWKKLEFPIISTNTLIERSINVIYNKQKINFIKSLEFISGSFGNLKSLNWIKDNICYFRIGILNLFNLPIKQFLPIIIHDLFLKSLEKKHDLDFIDLPPKWKKVILYEGEFYTNPFRYIRCINTGSKLFKFFNNDVFEKINDQGLKTDEKKLIADKFHAFAFLLFCIMNVGNEKWEGLCENHEKLINSIFTTLEISEFYILKSNGLDIVKIGSWESIKSTKEIDKYLPVDPSYLISAENTNKPQQKRRK